MADFKMKRSCAECICWDSDDGETGFCRAGTPKIPDPLNTRRGHMGCWPQTYADDWCVAGFKQDSEKVARRHRALEDQDRGASHAAHAPKDAE